MAVVFRVRGPRSGWNSSAPMPRVPRWASRSSAVIWSGATPSLARYEVVSALPKSSGNESASIEGSRWKVCVGRVGKMNVRVGLVVGMVVGESSTPELSHVGSYSKT